MQTNKLTPAEQLELDELSELIASDNWKIVRNLINRRRIHCEEQMKTCLKKHEDRKAGEWMARSEELLNITRMVTKHRELLIDKAKE